MHEQQLYEPVPVCPKQPRFPAQVRRQDDGADLERLLSRARKAMSLDTFWWGFAAGCVAMTAVTTAAIFTAKIFL